MCQYLTSSSIPSSLFLFSFFSVFQAPFDREGCDQIYRVEPLLPLLSNLIWVWILLSDAVRSKWLRKSPLLSYLGILIRSNTSSEVFYSMHVVKGQGCSAPNFLCIDVPSHSDKWSCLKFLTFLRLAHGLVAESDLAHGYMKIGYRGRRSSVEPYRGKIMSSSISKVWVAVWFVFHCWLQVVTLLRGENYPECSKECQKRSLQRTFSEEIFDAEEYNSTKYLSDLNRHKEVALGSWNQLSYIEN